MSHPAERADAEYRARAHICEAIEAGRSGGLSDREIAGLLRNYARSMGRMAFRDSSHRPREPPAEPPAQDGM